MHKYKIGQMVEIVDNGYVLPRHKQYIGLITKITGFDDGDHYNVEGISVAVYETALRPINPPAQGSWKTIATLLGTDIRRLRETV